MCLHTYRVTRRFPRLWSCGHSHRTRWKVMTPANADPCEEIDVSLLTKEDCDAPVGGDTAMDVASELLGDHEVESSEEEKKKPSSVTEWCSLLAAVDGGCYMKTRTGVTGETPEQDSFPWFTSSANDVSFVCLLWDLSPRDWRIVSFAKRPLLHADCYDPDEYLRAKQIMISSISDVLLEVAPSASLRLYLSETNQVVRLCVEGLLQDSEAERNMATMWADAIFAAMTLQQLEEEKETEAEAEVEGDQQASEADGEVKASDPQSAAVEFMDLRDQYFAQFPEQLPVDLPIDEEERAARKAERESQCAPDTSVQHTSSRFSAALDFTQIYGGQNTQKKEEDVPHSDVCCIIA